MTIYEASIEIINVLPKDVELNNDFMVSLIQNNCDKYIEKGVTEDEVIEVLLSIRDSIKNDDYNFINDIYQNSGFLVAQICDILDNKLKEYIEKKKGNNLSGAIDEIKNKIPDEFKEKCIKDIKEKVSSLVEEGNSTGTIINILKSVGNSIATAQLSVPGAVLNLFDKAIEWANNDNSPINDVAFNSSGGHRHNSDGSITSSITGITTNIAKETIESVSKELEKYNAENEYNYGEIKTLNNDYNSMDDNNNSKNVSNRSITLEEAKMKKESNIYDSTMHSHGIFKRHEIDLYHNRYRFGILNPYESIGMAREYLFFTKPDLNIYPRSSGNIVSSKLSDYLYTQSYWRELEAKYPYVIECLQSSYSTNNVYDPFNHLLENTVQSNLDVPTLNSEMVETPTNTYGVGYTYHGSSEASDDNFDFSLEFKDTRYLPVYHFFRAYEEYETFKHHGLIRPYDQYIIDKILYDQYSIYKFLVDEDGETIIYYAKLYGVKSKSLPRDTFNDTVFDNGISYTIDFNAAFFEDMKPHILEDFNAISAPFCNTLKYRVDIYNQNLDQSDNRPAKGAYIEKVSSNLAPGGYVYKLRWRGDAEI